MSPGSAHARGSRGAPPPRSPAAGSPARPPFSCPITRAAPPRSSCRCPSRSRARASSSSPTRRRRSRPHRPRRTRPPRHDADREQARVALAQRPRGARVDHEHVPRAGFAYFSHSLNELWPPRARREARPLASPASTVSSAPARRPLQITVRDPRRRGHVGGDDLRAHPPRAERRGRVADLQLLERVEVAHLLDQPRARVAGAGRRCRGRRCRSAAPAVGARRASPPAPPGSRCRRRRSRRWRSCRSR